MGLVYYHKKDFVLFRSGGNPIALSNITSRNTLVVDPDSVICWMSPSGFCDPHIRTDISWRNFIGQASGESYHFEWSGHQPVSVLLQPMERSGGIRIGID